MNQLVVCSYPVNNLQRAKEFYETLLGTELAESLTDKVQSFHAYVAGGVKFTLNQRRAPEEHAMCHFSVDNLDQAVKSLTEKGGKAVATFDVPIAERAMDDIRDKYKKSGGTAAVENTMGKAAIVVDPEGNLVGLIQLATFAKDAFKRGNLTPKDLSDQADAVEVGKKHHRA
jgi:predicted enzyme related to lactoylglutathione lyase